MNIGNGIPHKKEERVFGAREYLPTLRYLRNKGGFPMYMTEWNRVTGDFIKQEKLCQKTRSACLAMLFMIFATFNKENWRKWCKISNLQLSSWTGISRKSIPKYREILETWGIIEFRQPKSERAAGYYHLSISWWDKRMGEFKAENDNDCYYKVSKTGELLTQEDLEALLGEFGDGGGDEEWVM